MKKALSLCRFGPFDDPRRADKTAEIEHLDRLYRYGSASCLNSGLDLLTGSGEVRKNTGRCC
jgi:hypothetical protein